MSERVNHPAHYGGADNPYEHIKVAEALGWGYCIGNATKYLWRAGRKPGAALLVDLRKAAWYVNREIERLERDAQLRVRPVRRQPRARRGRVRPVRPRR